VNTDLSLVCTDPEAPTFPVDVLQRAFKGQVGASSMKALIQWDTPSKLSTWESEDDMKRRYHQASTWGQADSKEGMNVMTKRAIKRTGCLREQAERRQEYGIMSG
jgi:hypothetical protein